MGLQLALFNRGFVTFTTLPAAQAGATFGDAAKDGAVASVAS